MTETHRIETRTPFALDRVNCYYIHDSNPTLIDAGVNTEESFEAVEAGIRKAGGSVEKLKRIILTHAHSDHIGLVSKIVNLSGAKVYIHRCDAEKMIGQGEDDFLKRIQKFRDFFVEAGVPQNMMENALSFMSERFRKFYLGFSAVKPLDGGEIFFFDEFRLQVVHTPGHTSGSICMFDKTNGLLFSGDSLLEKITSNPVIELGSRRKNGNYRSLVKYMESLNIIKDLSVINVLPGHGKPFRDHHKRVQELQTHHSERMDNIIEILRGYKNKSDPFNAITPYELTKLLFHSLKDIELFLGLSEVYGHMEVLEDKGLISSSKQEQIRVYHLQNNCHPSV